MGVLFFISCDRQDKAPYFTVLSSEQTGITFVNTVENREDFNIFLYRNFYNGGGVGIGDVNNDGLPDIYLTANMSSNKLYLNKGDLAFEDITASAKVASENKWSTGVTMIDINNDGLLDIYVSNAGYIKGTDQKNELYINNGDLTFSEQASAYGLDNNGYSTHAAFFDYDNDGDLDVYILNNSFMPVNTLNYSNKRELKAEDWPVKDFLKGGGDKLMRNDNGVFTNVTDEAGILDDHLVAGVDRGEQCQHEALLAPQRRLDVHRRIEIQPVAAAQFLGTRLEILRPAAGFRLMRLATAYRLYGSLVDDFGRMLRGTPGREIDDSVTIPPHPCGQVRDRDGRGLGDRATAVGRLPLHGTLSGFYVRCHLTAPPLLHPATLCKNLTPVNLMGSWPLRPGDLSHHFQHDVDVIAVDVEVGDRA